jgi:hypothetical protein
METAIAFKEVYDILNVLGSEYINKIPLKMYKYICDNKADNYITNIHSETNFKEEKISKKALEIITYMNLQYWCNEEEKKELISKFNEKAEERKKKYSNIFPKETEAKIINNASLTVTPKVGIIAKIKEFLKKLFK